MRRPIVIGNWKMNGDRRKNRELLRSLASGWQEHSSVDAVVCPPLPYLEQAVQELKGAAVEVGAQDVSSRENGAYTGDTSAAMLADIGCHYVIVGHSERRQYHSETDELVTQKVQAVLQHGMTPVICVGETEEQREAGQTLTVIEKQLHLVLSQLIPKHLRRSIVAYEPLWAIGTGQTASPEQAQHVHAYIREQLREVAEEVRVIYGGSVKPENAEALFSQTDIDGALVGGASLKANEFLAICRAAG